MENGAHVPGPVLSPGLSWIAGEARLEAAAEEQEPATSSKAPSPALLERSMARLVPAPRTPTQPTQRVTQVCLGVEHGVLLTDLGIAFTWGDNRYGQLGRDARLLSEEGQPFAVEDLMEEELVQVAAGTHHCLALAASGLVWAWGRNKSGQLGCGSNRDQIRPNPVCHELQNRSLVQLGSGNGSGNCRILSISAGGNSSVASAANADIWQWGEISGSFKEREPGDSKKMVPVLRNRPYKVINLVSTKKGKVSISESGGKVLVDVKRQERDKIYDLLDTTRQWLRSIAENKAEQVKLLAEMREKENDASKAADPSGNNLSEMNDTIGLLEREIKVIDRELYLFEKNIESIEVRQAHIRTQIQALSQQAAMLSDKENSISMSLMDANRSERKELERKLAEVKEFLEANHNSRTSLLDERSEADKEKQRISHMLEDKRKLRERLEMRSEAIRGIRRGLVDKSAVKDTLMKFLQDQYKEIAGHVAANKPVSDFKGAVKQLNDKEIFLEGIDVKIFELTEGSDTGQSQRARLVGDLLQDLVGLHKSWSEILSDRWVKDDLDLSCFFGKAGKPTLPEKEPEAEEPGKPAKAGKAEKPGKPGKPGKAKPGKAEAPARA